MNDDISCFDCKYHDGICCMKDCDCMAIFDEWETAKNCDDYIEGDYDEQELERTNYK